ncbi:MAG: hypothetical protein H7252_05040 [Cytophaga sp.]|nr:hypothetical protein [Undibacterium sp.]
MDPTHRVVMNTGILYARMAITVVLSLYTTRLVLNALGVDDFGIFNLVGGVIAMLTFLNASMAAATQRFMSYAQGHGDEGRLHQIFNVSVVLHAGIAIIVLGILQFAGFILFDRMLKIAPERMQAAWLVYQFAVASTFITILGVPYDAVINARENMLLFAVLGVVEAVTKLAIALIIVDATTDKLELYGFLMAVTTVALLLMRAAYCHRRYHECKYALRRYFCRSLFNEMSRFAGWSLFGSATSMLANYGQILVLNMFFGAALNAAQGVAIQISGQLSVLAGTMLRALNPLIAKSEGAGNRQFMLTASIMGSKLSFFLLMIIYIPVWLEMPYLFGLWLKEVPQYAIKFCQLLLIQKLIEQLFITLAISISAVGNIRDYQLVSSVLTLFPLAVSFVFFRFGYSPEYLYYIFICYALASLNVTLYFAKKYCGLLLWDYFWNVIARCTSSFIIVIGVSSLPTIFMASGFSRLLYVSSLLFLSFFFSVWWIGLNKLERDQIKVILNHTFNKLLSRANSIAANYRHSKRNK